MENSEISDNRHWYALYSKPRHEFKAEIQLQNAGIEYYLPKITRIKQWSDRKKKVVEPLFSGYIFIRGNEKDRLTALEQYAIVRTIFFKGQPAIVPDWQIENLQKMLEKGEDISVSDKIAVGSKVKIISGPFKDVEGIVYENKNQEKMLAITIDLLRRSVIVRIPADSIIEQK
ncbi:MAG: UpxY family transcription antiterminator [Ignavibacteriales bacterium]|nr:UpxY family transcription antiterminator [Ignavibacteriota bacterium]MCB9248833.1 UpxY family transcription antiterminator [Ignavibacteriales bacterium]MCB9249615.1 UpxY family transcription antiterminator [Ignavibacteriales bacterium]